MHIYTYVCIIYTYNYTYNSNLLNSDNKAGNVIKVHIFCFHHRIIVFRSSSLMFFDRYARISSFQRATGSFFNSKFNTFEIIDSIRMETNILKR